jgi:hypothetical protein
LFVSAISFDLIIIFRVFWGGLLFFIHPSIHPSIVGWFPFCLSYYVWVAARLLLSLATDNPSWALVQSWARGVAVASGSEEREGEPVSLFSSGPPYLLRQSKNNNNNNNNKESLCCGAGGGLHPPGLPSRRDESSKISIHHSQWESDVSLFLYFFFIY